MPLRASVVLRRGPILLLAMAGLAAGTWAGLLRLGLRLPGAAELAAIHGPLMACTFLGTLVALERSVAVGGRWAFISPCLLGLSGPLALAGATGAAGLLATLGALGLAALHVPVLRRSFRGDLAMLFAGAISYLVGTASWALGQPVHAAVPWWIGFVALTVAAERWERSRIAGLSAAAGRTLLAAVPAVFGGMLAPVVEPAWGLRPLGAGLAWLAAWLLLHDVARLGLRHAGRSRFISTCILTGHGWLAASAGLALVLGDQVVGSRWDAVLHAFFLGFLFSMVMGHAPIVFPSVMGRSMAYRSSAWVPFALLQASLVFRLSGDLGGAPDLRQLGGLVGAMALVAFAVGTAHSLLVPRKAG